MQDSKMPNSVITIFLKVLLCKDYLQYVQEQGLHKLFP
jgi:hypothetical protein